MSRCAQFHAPSAYGAGRCRKTQIGAHDAQTLRVSCARPRGAGPRRRDFRRRTRSARAADQAAAASGRPRIGLVLAGGGAKGGAHVGVLKVLEEMHVPIDCIAGTSMGALVGGGYASGIPGQGSGNVRHHHRLEEGGRQPGAARSRAHRAEARRRHLQQRLRVRHYARWRRRCPAASSTPATSKTCCAATWPPRA